MKVLVTGGTGFVGAHVARAVRGSGHEIRLLARNPEKIKKIKGLFRPNAPSATDIAPGDMRDAEAVARAVSGCDAVVHCAADVGVASGSGPAEASANVDGARNVFAAARAAGNIPVIYTSTTVAFLPADDEVLTPRTPLAAPLSAYGASKRDAEELAARLRADGAAVTSLVLGGVYGPGAPNVDGGSASIIGALGAMMLAPPGGVGVIDVRDVSDLVTRLLAAEREPRRIMAGGRFVTWPEWTAVLSGAFGKKVPFHEVSEQELRDLGREMDERRAAGQDVPPLSEEAAIIMAAGRPTDDSEALRVLGREYRPTADTFRDTIAYLRETGRLTL